MCRIVSRCNSPTPAVNVDQNNGPVRTVDTVASVLTDELSGGGAGAAWGWEGSATIESLHRDTMMHPTKRWTEKCEHFTKMYSALLTRQKLSVSDCFQEQERAHDRCSRDMREMGAGASYGDILREIDNLHLFDVGSAIKAEK
jgi:hypothetical protein